MNDIKIVMCQTNTLKFADYNPRQATEKQIEDIEDSINKFGFVDPVIVNDHPRRRNIIVGGHMRVRVAIKLSISPVPCVFVNLVKQKEKELNIRLNQNTGAWDWDLLANNFENDDLLDWGFTEMQLSGESTPPTRDVSFKAKDRPGRSKLVDCPECGAQFEPEKK